MALEERRSTVLATFRTARRVKASVDAELIRSADALSERELRIWAAVDGLFRHHRYLLEYLGFTEDELDPPNPFADTMKERI